VPAEVGELLWMKGGLLGWAIYLWVLAGAESLLVWGILAGWTEGKVFLVARLKRCSFFAIFYFFRGGGVITKPRASPIPRLCIYSFPSPKRTRPQPTHPPPTSSTPLIPHLPYPLPKTTPPRPLPLSPSPPSSQPPRLT